MPRYVQLKYMTGKTTIDDQEMSYGQTVKKIWNGPIHLVLVQLFEGRFEEGKFKPIPIYPCMFYGISMISLIYVDDVLFFGPYQYKIDEIIKELNYIRTMGKNVYL